MSSTDAEIQLVAFDLGGVMFAEGTGAFISTFPADEQAVVREILKGPESMQLRRGRLAEDEFWSWAEPNLPAGWTVPSFRRGWYDAYARDEQIFSIVARMASRTRLAVFSGNVRSRVEYLDQRDPFRHFFDTEIFSYEVGWTKPEPEFVDAFLSAVDCPPEAIAYVDDKSAALAPALDRGVHGVLYRAPDIATVITTLEGLGLSTS